MESEKSPNYGVIRMKFLMRALRHRNYRFFFFGQGISLIGTWMQIIAVGWLIYRLTGSEFLLGVAGFASQIPTLIFAPFSGVLADRWNRHRILLITQTLAMIQAMALAFLVFMGNITVWQIILLSIFIGLINAFDMPARQSFVVEMIEKREDLGNAIALNALIINGSRLLGPAIAGVIIATMGESLCFFLNGLSYLAIIFALLKMKIEPRKIQNQRGHILQELREGFIYTFGIASIRYILLLFAVVNLAGFSYTVIMPVFAKEVLRGGPHTLGFLVGATGLGALVGVIYLASRKEPGDFIKTIPIASVIFGAGLIMFSFSRVLWLSLLLLLLTGFGMMVQISSSNTALQTLTNDDKRGRVMSFYTMAFMGMATFGSLLIGGLAGKLGGPHALLVSGIICILAAFLFSGKIYNKRYG